MNGSGLLGSQGRRLLQLGVALFLFTSFEGFVIPYFPVPIVGRSVHTLSAFLGVMLLAFGLIWPKLDLGVVAARIAFWFLVYSGLAITAAFFLAAISNLRRVAGTTGVFIFWESMDVAAAGPP